MSIYSVIGFFYEDIVQTMMSFFVPLCLTPLFTLSILCRTTYNSVASYKEIVYLKTFLLQDMIS